MNDKTRVVTLYEIKESQLTVSSDLRFFEMFKDRPRSYDFSNIDSMRKLMSNHLLTVQVPIEEVHYIDGRAPEFIAVDPALKEILTIDARRKLADAQVSIDNQKHWINQMNKNYSEWWSQPWYKRLWKALKGAAQ